MSHPFMQSTPITDFTDFKKLLECGTDEIVRRWLEAVRADREVPSTEGISEPLLIDSVPHVLREILRVAELDNRQIETAHIINAARHGRVRARQHFDVAELVREYQLLREHIFLYLQEHLAQFATGCDPSALLTIYRRVGLAVDEATRATIEAFVAEHTGELLHLSRTDSLTGLYNHRTFYERLSEEIKRAARYENTLTIALIDLDDFKAVNDKAGHQFGDRLLAKCAQSFTDALRETDIICRYGGDEFSVILPETEKESAASLMQRVQQAFKELGAKEGAPASFGMSFGLAVYPSDDTTPETLIRIADEQLLAKKRQRRNEELAQ
ncbi:MAG: diguanylate cyclase domain-containing protein [Pyrinomonadaceae bacterium]